MPYAVVLNSRQSKTPVGSDPWVASTLRAVRHATDRGYTTLGSLGLSTWELATWAAGACGGRLLVYIPYPYAANTPGAYPGRIDEPSTLRHYICHEFDLSPEMVEFRFQPPAQTGRTKKSHWPARDADLLALADIIYPVSVRPGGVLESLLAIQGSGTKTIDQFRVQYQPAGAPPAYPVQDRIFNPKLTQGSWPYITHWTRTAPGKWPGETAATYYHDLAYSRAAYPRSAIATLKRILDERLLRATSRHIRGGYPVVSFTALSPCEAVKLMRWRKRYVQWSFEPYGIAVDKDTAASIGIRPVLYGEPATYIQLPVADRPFFQNAGFRGGDWIAEHEWRHLGNLNLDRIPPGKIKIITQETDEMAAVNPRRGNECVALFHN